MAYVEEPFGSEPLIRCRVYRSDGKNSMGLFSPKGWTTSWPGKIAKDYHERMFVNDERSLWLLYRQAHQRDIIGTADTGSLFDRASYGLDLSKTDAARWFVDQGYTLPPELVSFAQAEKPPGNGQAPTQTDNLTGEDKALALLVRHPDWTNKKIAENAGCSRTSLYKWRRYKLARNAIKSGRQELPRGSKDKDGNVDSWNDDDEE